MPNRLSTRWTLTVTGVSLALLCTAAVSQELANSLKPAQRPVRPILLKPARVFDGLANESHEGWVVVVQGERILAAGPEGDVKIPEGVKLIELPGTTLLPGLIDAHSHVLLHAYDETPWEDQVLAIRN